jgi:hypothetical protein
MIFPVMPNVVSSSLIKPTVQYVSNHSDNRGGTFTVPAPVSPRRYVIYVTSNQSNDVALQSCTINGIQASVASMGNASFACALVPTGTSMTITPVYSSGAGGGSSYTGVVYVAYDLESPIWRFVGFNIGNSASVTLTALESSILLAPAQLDNDNQSASFATGMVRDFNSDNGSSYGQASAHHDAFASDQTYTVTCRIGTTNGTGCFLGVGMLR